jgi:hypothetical protein
MVIPHHEPVFRYLLSRCVFKFPMLGRSFRPNQAAAERSKCFRFASEVKVALRAGVLVYACGTAPQYHRIMKYDDICSPRRERSPAGLLFTALCATILAAGSPAGRVAASPNLPTYPGATIETPAPEAKNMKFKLCGKAMSIVSYKTTADPKAVAAWFKAHIPGAVAIDNTTRDGGSVDNSFEILPPDGSAIIVANRIDFNGSHLSAAAKTLGMDKTDIGVETPDSPLGSGFVSVVTQLAHRKIDNADAATKEAAKKQLEAVCPGGME